MQVELPTMEPVSPKRRPQPFDHRDWIFELKYDGFRGLAYIVEQQCRLVSRKLSTFRGFDSLRSEIAYAVHASNAILDGEIVSFDETGTVSFADLLNRKGNISYFAFDLLFLNGKDQRHLPLMERKKLLSRVLPEKGWHLLQTDYIEEHGKKLFKLVEESDLEGMVAKPKLSTYGPRTNWQKVLNPHYSGANVKKDAWDKFYGDK